MCGFVGTVGSTQAVDGARLEPALAEVAHRGPDDIGAEAGDWWALGFRRLSILDLSETGHQPMRSSSGRSWIVLNGEIYNYRSLRQFLGSAGWRFRGTSDTEVLLALYEHYEGDIQAVLTRINGMFAFAIVDEGRGRLVLARDRLGVKPLHYVRLPRGLAFASEIKSLLRLLPEKPLVSREALTAYLRLGFVPSWLCAFRGVEKLRPAHWAEWSRERGTVSVHRYWRPTAGRATGPKTSRQCIEAAGELLRDATRIRLYADVPLGLFLSGGIDSGLIAAQLTALGRADVVAHTIRFPAWERDESELARATAERLGLRHQVHDAEAPTPDELLRIVGHFDEPFADGSAIVTSQVSRHASEHATVILTGDGGDESFAGYSEYTRARWVGILDRLPDAPLRLLGRFLARARGGRTSRMGWRLTLSGDVRSAWTHVYPCPTVLDSLLSDEWKLGPAFDPESIRDPLGLRGVRAALDRAQVADLQLYLVDDVLTKVDMMSMKHSLEVRSPLLDYRLVELALSMPPRLRVPSGQTKAVLRGVAAAYLPPQVIRAPKRGFGVPLDRYLWRDGKVSPMVRDSVACLVDPGWFDRSALERYLDSAHPGADNQLLYHLLCLGIWKESRRGGPLT